MKISIKDLIALEKDRTKAIDSLISSANMDIEKFVAQYRELFLIVADKEDLAELDRFVKNHVDDVAVELVRPIVAEFEQIAKIQDEYFSDLGAGGSVSATEKATVFKSFLDNMGEEFQSLSFKQRDILRSEIRKQIASGHDMKALTGAFEEAGGQLKQYAATLANTSLAGVSSAYNDLSARNAGLDHGWYSGTLTSRTRSFCAYHLDRIYTRETIAKMSNGMLEPVIIYGGGYNCRHHWTWVDPDWDPKLKEKVARDIEKTQISIGAGDRTATVFYEPPVITKEWEKEYERFEKQNKGGEMRREKRVADALSKLGFRTELDPTILNLAGGPCDMVITVAGQKIPVEIKSPKSQSSSIENSISAKRKRRQSDFFVIDVHDYSVDDELRRSLFRWSKQHPNKEFMLLIDHKTLIRMWEL